jgi:hypothetical protein
MLLVPIERLAGLNRDASPREREEPSNGSTVSQDFWPTRKEQPAGLAGRSGQLVLLVLSAAVRRARDCFLVRD